MKKIAFIVPPFVEILDLAGPSIEDLANMVGMSPRNLSRVFKEKTGATIVEYLTLLRLELARTMLNNPDFTIEYIASRCGFKTARQLQRILKNNSKH